MCVHMFWHFVQLWMFGWAPLAALRWADTVNAHKTDESNFHTKASSHYGPKQQSEYIRDTLDVDDCSMIDVRLPRSVFSSYIDPITQRPPEELGGGQSEQKTIHSSIRRNALILFTAWRATESRAIFKYDAYHILQIKFRVGISNSFARVVVIDCVGECVPVPVRVGVCLDWIWICISKRYIL